MLFSFDKFFASFIERRDLIQALLFLTLVLLLDLSKVLFGLGRLFSDQDRLECDARLLGYFLLQVLESLVFVLG